MLKNKIYFTYQELIDQINATGSPAYPNDSARGSEWFSNFLTALTMNYNIYGLSSTRFTSSVIKDMVNQVMNIVYDRHAEDYLPKLAIEYGLSDTEPVISDFDTDDYRKAVSNIVNILNLTAPKYMPLLVEYEDASVDPVAPISSSTSGMTRFNDTPQDEGDFANDEHTTNLSESESTTSVDTGSIVSRLDDMYKNWRSVVLEWANEFDVAFLKEEQL